MKKALLVLGAGTDQVFMIKTARDMGLITVTVDANKNAPGMTLADYHKDIDFNNIDEVIKYCEELISEGVPLQGVSTMGSDIPHLVSKVATHFHWVGPSLQTGIWASHKYKMKQRFSEKNIPVPQYSLVENSDQILDCWREWGATRVIIKPTDRAGSRGVRVINYADDIESAFEYAKNYSMNGEILLEEYIDGLQISTETIVFENRACTPGFADRVYENMQCFWPNIMENGGWLPSSVDTDLYHKISTLVEDSARALGINNGVAKGDVVICPERGPMMIEMAARLSGGDFSESLVPLSSGVNYVRTAIEIAVGDSPDLSELKAKKCDVVANRYFFPPVGVLEDIRGIDVVKKMSQVYKFELYVKPGDTLPVIDSHAKRAGVFVIVEKDRATVQEIINDIYRIVEFKINGIWQKAKPCNEM